MLDLKSVRPLDAAIAGIALVVVVLGAYLGYSVWSHNRTVVQATPASRQIDALVADIKKNPNDIGKRMRLAQAFAVAGRDREAVQQYKAVLTVSKDYTPALSGLGFVALKQKQYTTGERYFRRVVELLEGKVSEGRDAQLEIAYFYLGNALLEQKQYEEAASNFKAALRLRRDASDTHYALAVCFRELGTMEAYRESLENTLMFDPKMPEANYDLGMLMLETKKNEAEAAEHFRVAAEAAPNHEKPREALAQLGSASDRLASAKKLAKSDPKQALVEARVAAALDPQSVEAFILVGDLWAKKGDIEKAQDAYRKALAVDPEAEAAQAGMERIKND